MSRVRGEYQAPWPYHAVIAGQPVMLMRNPDGSPSWIEEKVKYFDQDVLITAVDRTYQQYPAELEFPYALEDWSGGAGQADQIEGVRDRYWYARYCDASGGWPVMGPAVNTVPAGITQSVKQFLEFNGVVYALTTSRVYARPDDASAWTNLTPGTDFASGISGQAVVFAGTQANPFLFIPLGNAANYYVMSTAQTFTQHASQRAVAFEVVGNQLWLGVKASNQWGVQVAEDGGTAATWGAMTIVGDAAFAITDLTCVADRLLVDKEDGVYGVSLDFATVDEALTPELRQTFGTTNGVNSIAWNGTLVFRHADSLMRYDPDAGSLEQFGPELLPRNTSPVKGPVQTIAGQQGICLWATAYNAATSTSHLLRYGSWRAGGKDGRAGVAFDGVWHYSLYEWSKRITAQWVTGGSFLATAQPRMYLGASDGTVYYIVLARTANVLDDPSYRYNTADAGELYLPRYTALFPFEDKLVKAVGIGGRSLNGSSQQIAAQYKHPSDTSYASLGAVQEDPGARINLTSAVAAQALDFKLDLATTSNAATPVLTSFVVFASLRTQNLKEIRATIVAAEGVMDLAGKPMRSSWRDIRANLESAMTTVGSFTAISPAGEALTVIGIDFGHAYSPTSDDAKRMPVWTETIRMIQTAVRADRGTWDRASHYTWGSLSAFRWSDVAVI